MRTENPATDAEDSVSEELAFGHITLLRTSDPEQPELHQKVCSCSSFSHTLRMLYILVNDTHGEPK